MLAYKFLDAEGRAPFTGVSWEVGEWVEAIAADPCHAGVHACASGDVAIWIAASMWHVELEGEIVEALHKLVASRGRITGPVEGYDAAMYELREISAWRCRDRAVEALRVSGDNAVADRFMAAGTLDAMLALGGSAHDASFSGSIAALAVDAAHFAINGVHAQTPFVAACSAGHLAAGPEGDQDAFDAAYQSERDFQSSWLTARLDLE